VTEKVGKNALRPAVRRGNLAVEFGVRDAPEGLFGAVGHPVTAVALCPAATAGLMCSAVPMLADMLALRRVSAGFFGIAGNVTPEFATLTGLVVLASR
jgi:inner membrane transporter RhtA